MTRSERIRAEHRAELRALLPEDDDSSDLMLDLLLKIAENTILDRLGRDVLPARLSDMVTELALIIHSRLGNEGEEKRTEGDVSVSFGALITPDMEKRLRNYPRKVGAVGAADKKTDA